jgi:hypothetical protein
MTTAYYTFTTVIRAEKLRDLIDAHGSPFESTARARPNSHSFSALAIVIAVDLETQISRFVMYRLAHRRLEFFM